MKHYFYFILLIILVPSCVPELEETEIEYFISITGVSHDTVRVDDEIDIYINWINSPITDDLSLFFDDVEAEILSLNNDTVLQVLVPSGWAEGVLKVVHPIGTDSIWEKLYKDNHPQIFSTSPLAGKAGDIITLTGKEFSESLKTSVSINGHICELIELSNTQIQLKVPEKCGNGSIVILYWNHDVSTCQPDKKVTAGLFTSTTSGLEKRKISRYMENGEQFQLTRDATGKVIERTLLNQDGTPTEKYEVFYYNSEGLVESNTHFDGDIRTAYRTYSRNQETGILEIDEYNNTNNLVERHKYEYEADTLKEYNYYKQDGTNYYLYQKDVYQREDQNLLVEHTMYNQDGSIKENTSFEAECDSYNDTKPDLGIPGYEKPYPYYFLQLGSESFRTFYNKNGELSKVEKYVDCELMGTLSWYEYK